MYRTQGVSKDPARLSAEMKAHSLAIKARMDDIASSDRELVEMNQGLDISQKFGRGQDTRDFSYMEKPQRSSNNQDAMAMMAEHLKAFCPRTRVSSANDMRDAKTASHHDRHDEPHGRRWDSYSKRNAGASERREELYHERRNEPSEPRDVPSERRMDRYSEPRGVPSERRMDPHSDPRDVPSERRMDPYSEPRDVPSQRRVDPYSEPRDVPSERDGDFCHAKYAEFQEWKEKHPRWIQQYQEWGTELQQELESIKQTRKDLELWEHSLQQKTVGLRRREEALQILEEEENMRMMHHGGGIMQSVPGLSQAAGKKVGRAADVNQVD